MMRVLGGGDGWSWTFEALKTGAGVVAGALILALLPVSAIGAATQGDADYVAALRIAAGKVARQKAATAHAGALSSPMILSLLGRYYRKGDTWDVAAWREDSTIMRKMSDQSAPAPKLRDGGVFRYEVVDARADGTETTIEISQLESLGLGIVDDRVERLTLRFNDQLAQGDKSYRMKGRPGAVSVSPDGLRTAAMPTSLEMFPLDVPDVTTAERSEATRLPTLPEPARTVAWRAGFAPSLARSATYEQEDFFGRPVQVLWQKGDPWPAYMKTSLGIAILVRGGAR